ncbi:MAG: sensor histidine kinase [Planctomycetota bacterium]
MTQFSIKNPAINLIGSSTTKIIFYFLESQKNVTNELQEYKGKLEEKIIERTDEIENANLQLQEKVYEFELLNDKLKLISDSKTKYLLHATHQLKAPFAAIQSYTDILLQGYAGKLPDRAVSMIDKIKVRCDRLSSAIKNMLELANLTSCLEENIKMEVLSLSEIIPSIIESFSAAAKAKNIELIYNRLIDADMIKCNKEQIFMMIDNAIDNAINYSRTDSEININTGTTPDARIYLEVVDNGIGIPEDNVDKVFNEFFRSNNAADHYSGGTGLGLPIVKRIADIHRCKIEVESEVNKGTSIKFIFQK